MTDSGEKAERSPLVVVVSGDITMDWNLARQPLRGQAEGPADTRASWQRGGAALLSDLAEAIFATLGPGAPAMSVRAVEAPRAPIPPGDDSLNHSYALWSRFERDEEDKGQEPAWRVASFLGVDPARTPDGVRAEWARLARDLPKADVIALEIGRAHV